MGGTRRAEFQVAYGPEVSVKYPLKFCDMRYLIFLLLGLALSLPVAAGASTNTSRHSSGGTKYAFLGLTKSNKAKKAKPSKHSKKTGKKSSKKAPRSKASH